MRETISSKRNLLTLASAIACSLAILPLATLDRASGAESRDTGGIPQASCFWFGPYKLSNAATNAAYPEESALYWGARFNLPAGSRLHLDGSYPHARFMSLTSYVNNGVSQEALNDIDIDPKEGSSNPFIAGANREAANRDFRVVVPGAGVTPDPGENALLAPSNNGSVQELIYRVYLPDSQSDAEPSSLPIPTLVKQDATQVTGQALCDQINNSQRYFRMNTLPQSTYASYVKTQGADAKTNPARRNLRWEKYLNRDLALSIFKYGTPSQADRLDDKDLGEIGAFYDNRAVKYLVGPINQGFGKVLVLRGKLPTFPNTGSNESTMGTGQLRFWSICQNSSPVETRGVDCVHDSELPLAAGRKYTIVVSTSANRPREATRACKVAWLNWGTEKDSLGRPSGTLILRNLLADPNFANAAQKILLSDVAVTSSGTDRQRTVMGSYLPTGNYFSSKRAFDRSSTCSK